MSILSSASVTESNCSKRNSVVDYVGGAAPSVSRRTSGTLLDDVIKMMKTMGSARYGKILEMFFHDRLLSLESWGIMFSQYDFSFSRKKQCFCRSNFIHTHLSLSYFFLR